MNFRCIDKQLGQLLEIPRASEQNASEDESQKGHTSSDSVAQENVGENSTEDDVHVSIS